MTGAHDPNGLFDEFFHMQQQSASQQIQGIRGAYIGYIVQWFPNNTVIVTDPINGTIPSATDSTTPGGNATGKPLVSAPMPLATMYAGINGGNTVQPGIRPGIVIAPMGGAGPTSESQALGEQVLVINLNPEIGYSACAFMLFNDIAASPGESIPITNLPLQPGEWLFVNPSGTHVYFDLLGNVKIQTMLPPGGDPARTDAGVIELASANGITLQTGLINTAPDPLAQYGDIQMHSSNNIELHSKDFGITTDFSIIFVAGTDMRFATLAGDMSFQTVGGEIDLLSDSDINITADEIINMGSINLGSNMQLAEDATLSGAANLFLNAQDGDINAQATNGIALTANGIDGFAFFSNGGPIIMSTTQGMTIASAFDMNLNVTNGSIRANVSQAIFMTSGAGNINLNAGANFFGTGLGNASLVATNGNVFVAATAGPVFIDGGTTINLTSHNGDLTLNSSVDMVINAVNNVGIQGTGIVSLISTANDIQMTAGTGKAIGSIVGKATGNLNFIVGGTAGILAQSDVGIVSLGGMVTISASTAALNLQGDPVVAYGPAGPAGAMALLTDAFLTAFNMHTHGGVTAGASSTAVPDQIAAGGPPNETAFLFAL